MRSTVLRTALTSLALVLAGGCSSPTGPERPLDGKTLFLQHCARCHGTDGRGVPEVPGVRDLTDARVMEQLRNDQLKMVIRMGKPPRMPAFGNEFTDAALEVLVAYVRSLSAQPDAERELAPATP